MDRRDVLRLGQGFSLALLLARRGFFNATSAEAEPLRALPMGDFTPFSEDAVLKQAQELSRTSYVPPQDTIPDAYKALNYDQ